MNTQPVSKENILAQAQADPASEATRIEQSRAVAEVQAAVVVAQQKPRHVTNAHQHALDSCRMKGVAERAFFRFKRGEAHVSGESIHLARELARCWGNIDYGIKELDRDDRRGRSEMLAFAWDLETNTRAETTFIVPHKRDKKGGPVQLTDIRDIYENNANMGARRVRECIFSVLPPWLVEDARAACHKTLEDGGDVPMDKRRSDCARAFAEINVTPEQILAKIGRNVEKLTAADLANLGVILRSIRRGETTVDDEFPNVTAPKITENLKDAAKQNAKAETKRKPAPKAEPEPEPEPETGNDASQETEAGWTYINPDGEVVQLNEMPDFISHIIEDARSYYEQPGVLAAIRESNEDAISRLPEDVCKQVLDALSPDAEEQSDASGSAGYQVLVNKLQNAASLQELHNRFAVNKGYYNELADDERADIDRVMAEMEKVLGGGNG